MTLSQRKIVGAAIGISIGLLTIYLINWHFNIVNALYLIYKANVILGVLSTGSSIFGALAIINTTREIFITNKGSTNEITFVVGLIMLFSPLVMYNIISKFLLPQITGVSV